MTIVEIQTGVEHVVRIEPVEEADFKTISPKRYSFSWKKEKKYIIWKLCLEKNNDIIGLMSLHFIDPEQRVEIRLLASSIENVGPGKIFSGVASCLIAFACREAIVRYAEDACVSLIPKSVLREYYVKEYGMNYAGNCLCLIGEGLIKMIQKHDL